MIRISQTTELTSQGDNEPVELLELEEVLYDRNGYRDANAAHFISKSIR